MFANLRSLFEDWTANQKDHLIVWIPVFLGIGAGLYFSLNEEPNVFTACLLWFGSASFLAIVYMFRNKTGFAPFFLCFALFMTVTGFGLSKIKTESVYTPVLIRETGPLLIDGTVVHAEILDGKRGSAIILKDLNIEEMDAHQTPVKIRLTSKINMKVNLGERVRVLAKLMPPSKPVMPGAYDFRRHYFFDSIGGMGFVLKSPEILQSSENSALFLEKLRQRMGDHIKNILPERLSGIVTALLTGERASITEDDWDALRISGLAHIISISGLHVVLFAAPIFFFSRLIMAAIPSLALHYPIKKFAACIALLGCSLYVLLVVPTVPTYRALLMTGIGLIAIMLDRSPFSLRLISFAAIVVLLIAPESVWSASFQLSFAAVLCLIMAAEWTREYWSKWRSNSSFIGKFLIYLYGSIFTTFIVSIATIPLSAYHFQQIPVYSVVANALIIPLTGLVIMPSVIASFLLWPLGFQDFFLKFMAYGVEWLLVIAHAISNWQWSAITVKAWPNASMYFFLASGLSLVLLQGWVMRVIASTSVLAAFILITLYEPPSMIVAESGGVFLVRDGEKIYLSSSRKDKFSVETWMQRIGAKDRNAILIPRESYLKLSDGEITCGASMCRIRMQGRKISFGSDYYALREDCEWADIIVTPTAFRDKKCAASIYNKFRLWDTGAIEIREEGRLRTVFQSEGLRPWSPVSDKFLSSSKVRPGSAPVPASERAVYKHHSRVQE